MQRNCMGSEVLLTSEQARQLLGVSKHVFRVLVRDGDLTPKYRKVVGRAAPSQFFDPDEVEALALTRSNKRQQPVISVQAMVAVRLLEKRVKFLEEALGARIATPSYEEEDVIAYYSSACDDALTVPTEETVMKWARFFIGVDETFFDLVVAVTGDEEGWSKFFQLAQDFTARTPVEDFATNKGLEAAYAYFEVGRRNLRAAIFMHLLSRVGIQKARKVVGVDADVHEEILSILVS